VEDYFRQYGFIALLTIVAVAIPTITLLLSFMAGKVRIRPYKPNPIKYDPYECGMETIGNPQWELFNIRYYRFALLFVMFDVEAIFLFPWALRVNALGWTASIAVLAFLMIMTLGWLYEWRMGGMEWDETQHLTEDAEFPEKNASIASTV
jgi:NADH:ubiquinone oxidoreductase subunit 3 (subunit A)